MTPSDRVRYASLATDGVDDELRAAWTAAVNDPEVRAYARLQEARYNIRALYASARTCIQYARRMINKREVWLTRARDARAMARRIRAAL